MANSLLNAINSIGASQFGSMLKNVQNPMLALQQMAMSNPNLRPIVQALQNGANPEAIFRQMAKQKGINPDDFVKNLQNSIK